MTATTPAKPRGSRFAARTYDAVMRRPEKAGMEERRRRLIAQATGAVLEIGAGTGLNLAHYPSGLERLVITEPEPHMARQLQRKADALGRPVEIVPALAEELPFDDASFDTVVSTFALCTVGDPDRALEEIGRVLRPGGRLLFLEHVRADSERLARWQDRLAGPWEWFGHGCKCNQPTVDLVRNRGFDVDLTDTADWAKMPPIIRPLAGGAATKPT